MLWAVVEGVTPLDIIRTVGGKLSRSAFGPLYFLLLFCLRPFVFFPATAMCIAGGAVFGTWWGIFYTVLGANLGACLAYALGRLVASETGKTEESAYGLQKYLEGLRHEPFFTTLNLRLLLFPYDILNFAGGFLRLRFWPFLAGTVVGATPGMVAMVLFGASTGFAREMPELDPTLLGLSVCLFLGSLGLSRWMKGRRGSAPEAPEPENIEKANDEAGS